MMSRLHATIQNSHTFGQAAITGQENPAGLLRLHSVAFAHAKVALAAKLAAIDGPVNTREFEAYLQGRGEGEAFNVAQLRSLFLKAAIDTTSPLQYARQIASMAGNDHATRDEILQHLLQVAVSDAPLNAAEMELLGMVANLFAISRERLKTLVAQGTGIGRSPYEVLGLPVNGNKVQARARYLALVQRLHPDRFHAAGASADTMAMLSDQLAELNAAYDAVKRDQMALTKQAVIARWWKGKGSGANRLRNAKGAKVS